MNTFTAGIVGMFISAAVVCASLMVLAAVREMWESFFVCVILTVVFSVGASINIWWLITS